MDEQLTQANDELTQAQEAEAQKREAEQKIEAESQETARRIAALTQALGDANGYIEASDMAAMRERMFHRLDRDSDGFLSREELTPPAQSNHPAPNAVTWPDKDGDGKVSMTEFLSQEPALIVRGDRDGDHRLSADEFRQLIAARGK